MRLVSNFIDLTRVRMKKLQTYYVGEIIQFSQKKKKDKS